MVDLEENKESDRPGWTDVGLLQIRPREALAPQKFSFGLPVGASVAVGALLVAVLNWRQQNGGDHPAMIGYVLGSVLGLWIMCYVIGWLIFRLAGRGMAAGRVAVCIVALLSVMGAIGNAGKYQQGREDQAASAHALRSDVEKISQAVESGAPIAYLDPKATVGGEAGEIQGFVKAYLNQAISENNEYLAELEAIGWVGVLDPARVSKDPGLRDSKVIIANAKATVEKFRERWHQMQIRTRSAVSGMDTSTAMKRGFVVGFADQSNRAAAEAAQVWEMETQIVATAEDMIELLNVKRSTWTIETGQFAFSDEQVLSEFIAHGEKMDDLIRRQDALRKVGRDRALLSLKQAGTL